MIVGFETLLIEGNWFSMLWKNSDMLQKVRIVVFVNTVQYHEFPTEGAGGGGGL